MIKVEADLPHNLLIIRYSGLVTADEIEKVLEQIRNSLAGLQSGFRLLGDLSQLESMDVKCAPFIEKIMDLCNQKGIAMIVRVIPDSHRDIGLQIMSIFHYRGEVEILTCETLAQAEDLLKG